MTRYKIVLVPFPFDDLSSSKVRPAVCLTNPVGPYRHVVVAFITSHVPLVLLPTDFVVDMGAVDFAQTGLHVPSTIRLHRLMTLTTDTFVRELGRLTSDMETQIEDRLRSLFGL